jgi:hypothetical protein
MEGDEKKKRKRIGGGGGRRPYRVDWCPEWGI